jgi:putative MFS transporter
MGFARFIANFGLGGEVPVTTTLVAEFMPRNVRGLGTGTVMAAFGCGQVTAVLLGLLVIPNFGWKAASLGMGDPKGYPGINSLSFEQGPDSRSGRDRVPHRSRERCRSGSGYPDVD